MTDTNVWTGFWCLPWIIVICSSYIIRNENISLCLGISCENGGTLIPNTCYCSCKDSYTGIFCEIRILNSLFPKGKFALPMTLDGCPETDQHGWKTGFINMTIETRHRYQLWNDKDILTFEPHLIGPYHKRILQMNFCVKYSEDGTEDAWPNGTYCIYQVGDTCPTGFTSGSAVMTGYQFETDDTSGILPKHNVTRNENGAVAGLELFYCCRNDSISESFRVINEMPFFVFKHGKDCPNVKNGRLSEEVFKFSIGDTPWTFQPPHPWTSYKVGDKNVEFIYCYYSPLDLKHCYHESDQGYSYNGDINVTETGRPCMKWSQNNPIYKPSQYTGDFRENYCRMYMTNNNAWLKYPPYRPLCWTRGTNGRTEWEYCSVPICETDNEYSFLRGNKPVYAVPQHDAQAPGYAVDTIVGGISYVNKRPYIKPWIQVDMEHFYEVYHVIVHRNQRYYPRIFRHVNIYVSKHQWDFIDHGAPLCEGFKTPFRAPMYRFNCRRPITGQFVTIRNFDFTDVHGTLGRWYFFEIGEIFINVKDTNCGRELGLTSGAIYDFQLNVSSPTADYDLDDGRLMGRKGLCLKDIDADIYFQVDLIVPMRIQGLLLQGWKDGCENKFITSFSVSYSVNLKNFTVYEDPLGHERVFKIDSTLTVDYPQRFLFAYDILATVIRINVKGYIREPCLKLELIGCPKRVDRDLMCESGGQFIGFEVVDGYDFWLEEAKGTGRFKHSSLESCMQKCISRKPPCIALALSGTECDLKTGHRYSRLSKSFVKSTNPDQTAHRLCIKSVSDLNQCGGNITEPKLLTSPSYPLYYGAEINCSWFISLPIGSNIKIDVLEINLPTMQDPCESEFQIKTGKCEDKLTIINHLTRTSISLSAKNAGSTIFSQGNQAVIILSSCHRYTKIKGGQEIGFVLNISIADCAGCGFYGGKTSHMCTERCGYIASQNFPAGYDAKTKQQWTISAKYGQYIELTIQHLDIPSDENCNDAHVAIFDISITSEKSLLGKYCPWNRMDVITVRSSWHTLLIDFFTEYHKQGSGFLVKYVMVDFKFDLNGTRSLSICPQNWMAFDDSCYGFFKRKTGLTWFQAEEECNKENGHLVSIQSKEEMTFLHHLMTTQWNVTDPVYIGLQKFVDEQKDKEYFMWTNGLPLTYMAWQSDSSTSQPDGHARERCTVIKLSSLWSIQSWHDSMCAYNKYNSYICEIISTDPQEIQLRDVIESHEIPKINGTYLCKNGEIVSEVYLCDGIPDCTDLSDEDNCNGTCHEGSFKCSDGSCISISLYCDYRKDCPDGSDEISCVSAKCSETEWRCGNGQCIPQKKRCDFKEDCVDGSDEMTCDLCNNSGFQCYDQSCIPQTRVCDGFVDCSGPFHEDETGCMNNVQESCAAWFGLGKTQDGVYMVDYEEQGYFAVECKFPKHRFGMVTTILHHPFEDRITVHDSIHIHIPFKASDKQLKKLLQSDRCHQFVKVECRYGGVAANTQLTCQNGKTYKMSGYFTPSCSCFLNASCGQGNKKCNCLAKNEEWYDVKSYEWFTDEGYIDQKHRLPLRNFTMKGVDAVFRAVAAVTIGPLVCTGDAPITSHLFRCKNGVTTNLDYRCLMDTDENGEVIGCRDLSHLEGCENTNCNGNFLKCPNSYCISRKMLCDGIKHCPDGSDEDNCGKLSCPGLYKCRESKVCLPINLVCDGIKHCKNGDDELLCDRKCPIGCVCEGLFVRCHKIDILDELPGNIRKLDISSSDISERRLGLGKFKALAEFNASNCKLELLDPNTFSSMENLYSLDLVNNSFKELDPGVFKGLINLHDLHLYRSLKLSSIYPGTFDGLDKVPTLNLTHTKLDAVGSDTFRGLNSLFLLNLSYGHITHIADSAFAGLDKLNMLDLRGNEIKSFSKNIFAGLSALEYLYTDSHTLCCLRPPSVTRINCLPAEDEFSSCSDLMRNSTLRMFLWLIGSIALVGNTFVIIYRLCWDRGTFKKSYGIFVANLGVSDFLMGVYLFIIASADQYYRDVYIWNDYAWRNGTVCTLAGFLVTLSNEASTLFLCFITLDRMLAIKFPFSTLRFTTGKSIASSLFVWAVAFFIASMPLSIPSYFQNAFYSKTGVCLALPLTRERPPGWEYSMGVFIMFNFIAFVMIAFGQALIYAEIRSVSSKVMKTGTGQEQQQVARNLFLVVISDFLCWFPIGIMGMIAVSGYPIHSDVYAWTAVFILPFNSALNPILYTVMAILRKKERERRSNTYAMTGSSGSPKHASANGRHVGAVSS